MAVLSANNLAKSYGAHDIFAGISVEIPHGAKIALVGANGIGKTTLLEVLIKHEEPSAGVVHHMKGLTIGYLPQRPELRAERALWDEMLTAFEELRTREAQLVALTEQMSDPNRDDLDELIERYGRLEHDFETRALLARLLLESPDLLVLDEPTNHLDINAVEWLESFLKSWPGALLVVSHDRYFMDSVVTTIWEMAWGSIEVYRGNYSH